jgi:alkanesulfonate monooxygenase SsuD/methylene tetrahydromethanopterin reductase-like flavin-dependent oxidoreductase (luciferase family)
VSELAEGAPRPIHPWVAEGEYVVRLGVAYGPTLADHLDWPALHDFVAACEEVGIDSFWVPDHPPGSPDPWVSLAALAVATRRIRLGPLVSCVSFRNPVHLARLAADVDRLGDGRLILGLGIGDLPSDFERLGIPCPPVPARQRVLEEVVQIVRASGGPGTTRFVGSSSGSTPPPSRPARRRSRTSRC